MSSSRVIEQGWAALFGAFFLWVAENVGTRTGTWVYAGTSEAAWASLSRMGSWYLLLYVSFITVTLVYREMLGAPPPAPRPAEGPTEGRAGP